MSALQNIVESLKPLRQMTDRRGGVVCVGSLNIDLFCYLRGQFPKPGETIHGLRSSACFGGKGGNQAVMAARLGAPTAMVGRVGNDLYGNTMREAFEGDGIDTRYLLKTADGIATGTAQILVNGEGQNMIIVIAGANGQLAPADVQAAEDIIAQAAVLMVQMEIPAETSLEALRLSKAHGVFSILNPAPAPEGGLSQEFLSLASLVCPNETELAILTQRPIRTLPEVRAAAHRLLNMGAASVLVTLGAQGAMLLTAENAAEGGELMIPPKRVERVVDTSGAGDCYLGSLAAFLSRGVPLKEAATKAGEMASLSVCKAGTQPSYPFAKDLPANLQLPPLV